MSVILKPPSVYNENMSTKTNQKSLEKSKKPIQIIQKNISAIDVAKYYLEVEFHKLFEGQSREFVESIVNTIQNLSESKTWALLEAISFTYHINGVFYKISRDKYVWNEEVWSVKDLVLTGMDSKANKVIFSEEVNGDAMLFKQYLLNYFATADPSDPEGLFSYKPKNEEIIFNKLIMTEEKGEIRMLDGSHRLIEMLLTDVEEVVAYVGHPTDEFSEESQRVRIGNSTFIMLTIMFKRGNPEEREAVLTLVRQLIDYSLDGRDAVQRFWIDQQRDEEILEAGEELLKSSP